MSLPSASLWVGEIQVSADTTSEKSSRMSRPDEFWPYLPRRVGPS